ncbi:MAG: TetR/AcrR family transcriptional regulator [Proteobacteria bacterium]|nr:TetR/AcrR family transcriptional regulator [Pseudomonadota bacterium]
MRHTLTDDEFMDQLTDLLCREGIKNLTIGEMAARLRCSRRRLYEIARTKEEIFCAAVEHYLRRQLREGEALLEQEQDQIAALAAYLDVGVRASAGISLQFVRDLEDSARARACFDAYQQARADKLSEFVDQGVRKGVFVDCHGLVVSELLLGAALRLRQTAFLARAKLSMEEAFQELYQVLLHGLLNETTEDRKSRARQSAKRKKLSSTALSTPRGPTSDMGAVNRALMDSWERLKN